MQYAILLIFIIFIFNACATRPESHAHKLPWGAIDLDINSKDKCSIKNSLGTILTQKANRYSDVNGKVPFDILTLTGGGSRGAFGTGLLVGWSDKGGIPKFDIVTGVSTGAVMAPFIFLGGDELDKVEHFYTKMYTEDIFVSTWTNFFGYGHIINAKPLKKLFSRNFN